MAENRQDRQRREAGKSAKSEGPTARPIDGDWRSLPSRVHIMVDLENLGIWRFAGVF